MWQSIQNKKPVKFLLDEINRIINNNINLKITRIRHEPLKRFDQSKMINIESKALWGNNTN